MLIRLFSLVIQLLSLVISGGWFFNPRAFLSAIKLHNGLAISYHYRIILTHEGVHPTTAQSRSLFTWSSTMRWCRMFTLKTYISIDITKKCHRGSTAAHCYCPRVRQQSGVVQCNKAYGCKDGILTWFSLCVLHQFLLLYCVHLFVKLHVLLSRGMTWDDVEDCVKIERCCESCVTSSITWLTTDIFYVFHNRNYLNSTVILKINFILSVVEFWNVDSLWSRNAIYSTWSSGRVPVQYCANKHY